MSAEKILVRATTSLRVDDRDGRLTGAHACPVCGMRYLDADKATDCCLPGVEEHARETAAKGWSVRDAYRGRWW